MIVIQDLDYNNVTDFENQYREYLKDHIQNVNRSWNEFLKPSLLKNLEDFDLIEDDLSDIDEVILNHDASKYSDEEFEGYRQWWYPVDDSLKDEVPYNQAWNHHQKVNPHHWRYWLLVRDGGDLTPLDMPFKYVCDADVVGLPYIHIEAKNQEKMYLYDWIEQAKRDTKANDEERLPAVFHKKNNAEILVTMTFDDFMKLYREFESSMTLRRD